MEPTTLNYSFLKYCPEFEAIVRSRLQNKTTPATILFGLRLQHMKHQLLQPFSDVPSPAGMLSMAVWHGARASFPGVSLAQSLAHRGTYRLAIS